MRDIGEEYTCVIRIPDDARKEARSLQTARFFQTRTVRRVTFRVVGIKTFSLASRNLWRRVEMVTVVQVERLRDER